VAQKQQEHQQQPVGIQPGDGPSLKAASERGLVLTGKSPLILRMQ